MTSIMDLKYFVFDDGLNEVMVIFPSITKHDIVAQNLNVVSAGFIDLTKGECYGKSIGLRKESRPERDSKIFQTQYERKEYDKL